MYIDVYFCINMVLNYLIIVLAVKFSCRSIRYVRSLIAAISGALYSVLMLNVDNGFINLTSKIIMPAIMMILSRKNFPLLIKDILGSVIRELISFNMVTFSLGGSIYIIQDFFEKTNKILPWYLLLIGTIFGLFMLISVSQWLPKGNLNAMLMPMQIHLSGKNIIVNSYYDSGNRLYHPVMNIPVVLINNKAAKKLMNLLGDNYNYFLSFLDGNNNSCIPDEIKSRFCIIPYDNLNGTTMYLNGLIVDKVEVRIKGKWTGGKAVVAICQDVLDADSRFDALSHIALIKGE